MGRNEERTMFPLVQTGIPSFQGIVVEIFPHDDDRGHLHKVNKLET